VTASRPAVPAHVDAAVRVALEKLPADRFAKVAEFSEALRGGGFTLGATTQRAAATGIQPSVSRWALPAGAALAVVGIAAAVWARLGNSPPAAAPVVQLFVEPPNANPDLGRFAVSSDGSRFAFTTDEGIALRDVGQREYRLLSGTDRAASPSFSPDGEWIVYHVNGQLRKVSVAGGSPMPVIAGTDSLQAERVSWGEDGSIVFEGGFRLYVIPPDGGAPRLLAKALGAEQPRLMPDGSGVLYVDQRHGSRLMYYDLTADSAFVAVESAGAGQYLPTGHIIYAMSTGGLFTVPFNPKRPTRPANPTPILADIQPNGGIAPFIVTRNGTLVYRAGLDPEYRLLVRQPNGKVDSLPMAPKVLSYARFSPDGRSLAITIGSARGTSRHTAIYDVSRGTLTRFTVDGGGHSPVWSPDGTRLAFTAEASDTDAEDLFVQPVDRSNPPRRLARMPNDQHASAWPVDTMLVYSNNNAPRTLGGTVGGGTVSIVNPNAAQASPRPYLSAAWGEFDAAVSPDGQWAAFTSDESGRQEVFVRRFPVADAGGVWKISSGGGYRARWSGDGRTIYYQTVDNKQVRAVRVTPGSTFVVGASETIMTVSALGNAWDVDRHSGRLVVAEPVSAARLRIVVMQHWLDDFRRRAAAPAERSR
jgi:serine/threonine-protein kinase